MAEIKFSCGQCGQHISCDEGWSGHQIQCPACQTTIDVPHAQVATAPAAVDPKPQVPQPPAGNRSKLSAGVTQVARSTPPSTVQRRPNMPRPPKTTNPAIKYAATAVLVLVVAGAALRFLPGLLNEAQEISSPKTSGATTAPAGGGGPLGEMNGAMDVSDALDGSGPARSRPTAVRPPAVRATNTAGNGKAPFAQRTPK
jgi:hypothetical protein